MLVGNDLKTGSVLVTLSIQGCVVEAIHTKVTGKHCDALGKTVFESDRAILIAVVQVEARRCENSRADTEISKGLIWAISVRITAEYVMGRGWVAMTMSDVAGRVRCTVGCCAV